MARAAVRGVAERGAEGQRGAGAVEHEGRPRRVERAAIIGRREPSANSLVGVPPAR